MHVDPLTHLHHVHPHIARTAAERAADHALRRRPRRWTVRGWWSRRRTPAPIAELATICDEVGTIGEAVPPTAAASNPGMA